MAKSISQKVYECINAAGRPISPQDIAAMLRIGVKQVIDAGGKLDTRHRCVRNVAVKKHTGVLWEAIPFRHPPVFTPAPSRPHVRTRIEPKVERVIEPMDACELCKCWVDPVCIPDVRPKLFRSDRQLQTLEQEAL